MIFVLNIPNDPKNPYLSFSCNNSCFTQRCIVPCQAARSSNFLVEPRSSLETQPPLARQLSHAVCGTGVHPLDCRRSTCFRLLQKSGALAVLRWFRPGMRSGASDCTMAHRCCSIHGAAAHCSGADSKWEMA